MATINEYTSKAVVNADTLLSIYNVNSTGDTISADTWVNLWRLVFTRLAEYNESFIEVYAMLAELNSEIADYGERITDLEELTEALVTRMGVLESLWATLQEAYEQASEDCEEVHDIYDAIKDELVHYGATAPTNAQTKLWIQPTEELPNMDPIVSWGSNDANALDTRLASAKLIKDTLNTKLSEIPNNSITSPKVVTGAITNTKLAVNTIGWDKYGDDSITTPKLVDGCVYGNKLLDGAVITAKLANQAVTADKICDSTITEAKLAAALAAKINNNSGSAMTVDTALSTTSVYPVQNRVVTAAINNLQTSMGMFYGETIYTSPTSDGVAVGTVLSDINYADNSPYCRSNSFYVWVIVPMPNGDSVGLRIYCTKSPCMISEGCNASSGVAGDKAITGQQMIAFTNPTTLARVGVAVQIEEIDNTDNPQVGLPIYFKLQYCKSFTINTDGSVTETATSGTVREIIALF